MEPIYDIQTTINKTRQWGLERNLHGPESNSAPEKQFEKLEEEFEELREGIEIGDIELMIDSIGDCTVVLIQLAEKIKEISKGSKFENYNFEDCLRHAYKEISQRTGKTVNGTFIKDK